MKHSDSMMEPQQHFKRNMDRDTYGFTWTGNNGGKTNWSVDANYSRTREDDVTVSSYYGKSSYEGKNQLEYVDDVDHRQLSISANASTQINDKHLLSYGFGFSKEDGSGSRLKSAPDVTLKRIDPWDYDKSLFVISKESPLVSGQSGEVASNVHAYEILRDENGIPYWNNAGNGITMIEMTRRVRKPTLRIRTISNTSLTEPRWFLMTTYRQPSRRRLMLLLPRFWRKMHLSLPLILPFTIICWLLKAITILKPISRALHLTASGLKKPLRIATTWSM